MRGIARVAGVLREWLSDRPAQKARIAQALRCWPALDRRVRAVLRASTDADLASSAALARPPARDGAVDWVEPLETGTDGRGASTDERILAVRMAYVTALEDALDDEAVRHRAEIDSLAREIERLRDEIAHLKH